MTNNIQSLPGKVRSWLYSYLDTNHVLIFESADGNTEILRLDGTSAQIAAVINQGEADVDTRIAASSITNALFVQGSDGFTGLGNAAPATQLDVTGTITADGITNAGALSQTGDVNVDVAGDDLDLEGTPSRYVLKWTAGENGIPGLLADLTNSAEGTRMIVDPNFEVIAPTSGSNASSDDVTQYAEGGITLTTDGGDGDGLCIQPHQLASRTAWAQTTWGTDQSTRWEGRIRTGGNIGNAIIWAGMKLTDTDVVITDNDQVYFRYENGVNDGEWQFINSRGGTDVSTDTGVVVAIDTEYHFVIDILSGRTVNAYINGTAVTGSPFAALDDTIDLIPFIAVEADGAGEAKVLHIRSQAISRAFA